MLWSQTHTPEVVANAMTPKNMEIVKQSMAFMTNWIHVGSSTSTNHQ
jgi:hypothetical protein